MNTKVLTILFFILGIIGAGALFAYMHYVPYQKAEIEFHIQDSILTVYSDSVKQTADVQEQIPLYKARLSSLKGLLDKATEQIPTQANRNHICELLLDISHEAEVTIVSSVPQPAIDAGQGGSKMLPISLVIEGTYYNVGKFLSLIANNKLILKVSNITLNKNSEKKGMVSVSTTVNAYYLPVDAITTTVETESGF